MTALMITTKKIEIKTSGENDIVNITDKIQSLINDSDAVEGNVVLFLQSTTSALTIIEYEGGLLTDIPNALNRIAPKSGQYEHERAYHDGNGHSHVRSSIIGASLTIPFSKKTLLLGTWQQIVLMEFDVPARTRSLIVQIVSG